VHELLNFEHEHILLSKFSAFLHRHICSALIFTHKGGLNTPRDDNKGEERIHKGQRSLNSEQRCCSLMLRTLNYWVQRSDCRFGF
jgi:hypothetical protein